MREIVPGTICRLSFSLEPHPVQHPLMKLAASLATGLAALFAVWQGLAGWWRGVVLVYKRGDETWIALADNPAAFWFCVLGWFVLCGMFGYLCLRYWRGFSET